MRRKSGFAIAAVSAGLGLSLLGACAAPQSRTQTYYAPAEQTTTTYYAPGTGPAATTTTTQTTVYANEPYSYGPSGRGDTYDDPHHYGRGYNQHKY